jgi:RNA polymerase sigma-70 factor (ECF subfamily)
MRLPIMSETSVSLLDRLRRRGEPADWDRLVGVYTPLLHGWLTRAGLQAADREDLAQDVLAAVVRDLPHFEHNGRRGAFRRWLRTILVHRLRHFLRGRRQQPHALDEPALLRCLEELESPESELSRLWDAEHDRYVVGRLLEMIRPDFAPSTWEAFRRQALDGAPVSAVAAELGLSANAVCIARSRVLGRLRREAGGLLDA